MSISSEKREKGGKEIKKHSVLAMARHGGLGAGWGNLVAGRGGLGAWLWRPRRQLGREGRLRPQPLRQSDPELEANRSVGGAKRVGATEDVVAQGRARRAGFGTRGRQPPRKKKKVGEVAGRLRRRGRGTSTTVGEEEGARRSLAFLLAVMGRPSHTPFFSSIASYRMGRKE